MIELHHNMLFAKQICLHFIYSSTQKKSVTTWKYNLHSNSIIQWQKWKARDESPEWCHGRNKSIWNFKLFWFFHYTRWISPEWFNQFWRIAWRISQYDESPSKLHNIQIKYVNITSKFLTNIFTKTFSAFYNSNHNRNIGNEKKLIHCDKFQASCCSFFFFPATISKHLNLSKTKNKL